jgi:uncharacterized membrane protein
MRGFRSRGGEFTRLTLAGLVLGLALSGFFDGILLHQILQWHHLFSLAPGLTDDLAGQIMADGLFHAAMYVVALAGIGLLWRARSDLAGDGAGMRLLASLLVGFGLWNVADVIVFHWLAGIHRVRVDVPDPLAWDLGWLVGLGIVPMALAVLLRPPFGGDKGPAVAVVITALVVLMMGVSARPASPGGLTGVMFRPGISAPEAWAVVARLDGRVAWMSEDGQAAIVALPAATSPWRLYAAGALIVGNTGLAGCASWRERAA